MKRLLTCLLAATCLCGGCIVGNTLPDPKDARGPQVLRHVVLFKFKDDTTASQVRDIENAFCALPSKIDVIHDFEWGTDVSVENLAQGYTHCFFVTFKSEADRAAYLPHPDHKKFGEVLGPHLDKVLVLDYWTK